MIASMLSSRGINLIADTPLNPQTMDTAPPPGTLPSTRSASIGPCVIDDVSPRQQRVTAFYPVAILWRFPGDVPYHSLPVGLIESLAISLEAQPLSCPTEADWMMDIEEWMLDVYRYEDGRDWVVELGIVFRLTYDWEPEDLSAILGGPWLPVDETYTIDTLNTTVQDD